MQKGVAVCPSSIHQSERPSQKLFKHGQDDANSDDDGDVEWSRGVERTLLAKFQIPH